MKYSRVITQVVFSVTLLIMGSGQCFAEPSFASTSDPSSWQVATNVGGVDGAYSSFPTDNFQSAVAITNRPGWIANNSTGTNGWIGRWTFFVFRQTFDLTGYDPETAVLQFQWAADDSGEGFADRGKWTPKFRLNGGDLINGSWSTGNTYSLGLLTTLTGFVSGVNTLDFYVEGNGVTDGFSLKTVGFTADNAIVTPEPASMVLFGLGGAAMAFMRRRKA